MTEAAMLSALFVVMTIIAITTGVAYSLYLEMVVPIIISLIYLRCGFKYTVLSAITSLLIIVLGLGDIISGIWMSQSILLGLICGIFIQKEGSAIDDIVYCSIIGCILMIFIDIYFSTLTGYSFIKESEGYAVRFSNWAINKDILHFKAFNLEVRLINWAITPQVIIYILVACLPLGTVIMTYFGAMVLGNKLNLLNQYGKNKFMVIKNFRKYSYYICCSKKITAIGITYLAVLGILELFNYHINIPYINTVVMAVKYIFLYVIIKDAQSFIGKYIYMKTKSKKLFTLAGLGTLALLIIRFKITTCIMILCSSFINLSLNMRDKQIKMLQENVLVV